MGENGAGKSTLIKAITGALRLDQGEILLDGRPMQFSTPADAQAVGISTVYQEIDLLPNLTVAENISLGREPRRFGMIDHRAMRDRAASALAALGVNVDPSSVLSMHPLAIQQLVAIARAVSIDVKGIAIVFVSHFLDQVYEICDRVTVLRGGRLVGEYGTRELLRIDLVEKMLGAAADALAPLGQRSPDPADGPSIVSARGLASGVAELARALTGVDHPDGGEVRIDGEPVRLGSPREAIRRRVAYSSENRRNRGDHRRPQCARQHHARPAGAARDLPPPQHRSPARARHQLGRGAPHPSGRHRPAGRDALRRQPAEGAAGQAPRALPAGHRARRAHARDRRGAKAEIQRLVGELSDNGLSIVYISAEFDEVLRVAHLVAVMRDGVLAQILPASGLTSDALLALVAKPATGEEVADG
ncbi:hypothetical protein LUZ63_021210 [Rhynchospora breviuscula]|uniref:ABC transporter domain-containing protein n=1 Tax=Rhynchospora breviuscula TaxID=2022672 RepID=A0A9Q0BZ13_9POAL|nr:hypothetical protein LUZ63_021210 [Rhynchospora breviuscula]